MEYYYETRSLPDIYTYFNFYEDFIKNVDIEYV